MVVRDLTHLAHSCRQVPFKHNNLSVMERQALKNQESDNNIVIRNADKGGTVVILNSDMNKNEALHQLSDTDT